MIYVASQQTALCILRNNAFDMANYNELEFLLQFFSFGVLIVNFIVCNF